MKRIELIGYQVRAPRAATFPLDMLRYSASWPASAEAAAQIERSIRGEVSEQRGNQAVDLQTYEDPRTFEFASFVKRWHSFGWTVYVKDADGEFRAPGPFVGEHA